MKLPSAGEVFADQYRVEELLGKGGFAHVFRATRLSDHQAVALKVLTPEGSAYSRDARSRFSREIKLVGQLRSPYVVALHDAGETTGGLLYMVFELIEGRDLRDILAERGTLDVEVVEHVLRQLLSALQEAHRLGLLHRDIKPDNIRVFDDGQDPWRVKLLDFGIAKPTDPSTTQITKEGHWVGTPRYMSPEQLHKRELSPASDIYSLGVTAFEMLMGSDAMHGAGLQAQLDRLMHSGALHVPDDRAGRLREVLHRMVTREPRDRYRSAQDVLAALGATTPSTVSMAERKPAIPRVWVLVAGLALVVVAAIAATSPWDSPEDEERNRVVRRVLLPNLVRGAAEAEPQRLDAGAPDVSVATPDEPPDEVARPRFTAACDTGETSPTVDKWYRPDMDDGREVGMFVPRSDPKTPFPVVLMFHMKFRSDRDLFDDSGIEAVARTHGFVVIVPRDKGQVFPWTDPAELDLPEQLIDWAGEKVCLDRERVFAIGNGEGAELVDQARCEMRLAGIATANHRSLPRCSPPVPVPHLHFVALKDRALGLNGERCSAEHGPIPTLGEFTFAWQTANACRDSTPAITKFEGMECRRWACDAPFTRCDIDAGWGWPFQKPNLARDFLNCDGDTPTGVPMAETAWKFFEANGPPAP